MQQRLHFYNIDIKYVRNLSQVDDNILSVSPQIDKINRPLVGILLLVNGRSYCVPLSSPKEKHIKMKNSIDFLKIKNKNDEKVIGVLNFNNMMPVERSVIKTVNLHIKPSYDIQTRYYINLLNDQLDWCNDNKDAIIKKAQRLYDTVTNPTPSTSKQLLKRCCNFKKLEEVLDRYISKQKSPLSRNQIKKNANTISQQKHPQQSQDKSKNR